MIMHDWFWEFCYSSYYKRQFVTTSTNTFSAQPSLLTSNPGIVAEASKKKKHDMELWANWSHNMSIWGNTRWMTEWERSPQRHIWTREVTITTFRINKFIEGITSSIRGVRWADPGFFSPLVKTTGRGLFKLAALSWHFPSKFKCFQAESLALGMI